MKHYIVALKDMRSLESIIAVTDSRKRAVSLVGELEEDDKYLGLYQPKRYTILVQKSKNDCAIVRS